MICSLFSNMNEICCTLLTCTFFDSEISYFCFVHMLVQPLTGNVNMIDCLITTADVNGWDTLDSKRF